VLAWFSSRSADDHKAAELYGAVVAQARRPAFYSECGIQDTPEGRYELIVLHLFLLLERLAGAGDEGSRLSRLVIEAFVGDMDDSLREMGVGDLSVPKKVKKAAAGLYDRAAVYRVALRQSGAGALQQNLEDQIPGLSGNMQSSARLAAYVHRALAHLASLSIESLVAGRASFPVPELGPKSTKCDGGLR
jgi:cytochrome b pre-mRNA-processing protein 3